MKEPIRITLEAESPNCSYVYYSDQRWASSAHISEEPIVEVDLDVNGDVIGIEMIGIGDDTVEIARTYALSRGLEFPTDWRARLAALKR